MTEPRFYFSLDAESIGLDGPVTAVGFVVLDASGVEVDSGGVIADPITTCGESFCGIGAADIAWYAEHVLPAISSLDSTPSVVDWLVDKWELYAGYGWMVTDHPWPVESNLLSRAAARLTALGIRPYPIIDVASVLCAAGMDPLATYPRLANEEPRHNPVCDARQSARLFWEARQLIGSTSKAGPA